jgi:gamma-glutamyltranspeptidase / glutathione hydrolase
MSMRWDLPYPSRRQPVLAGDVVATSQPLAAQAGMAAFERGGNAVDAAIATAVALTVVEPTSNGLGSDAFALVWDGGGLHGLNGSGRSPAGLDAARLSRRETMPLWGWDTVTVPGAVAVWRDLSERWGRLDFAALFEPAVRYARDGFAVSPLTAQAWARAESTYRDLPDFGATFLPGGRAPRPGERFTPPHQARTLERIATTGGEDFYRGALAAQIAGSAEAAGAALRMRDLELHAGEWVEPISHDVLDATVHEIPPNGQGVAALIALGILEHTPGRDAPIGTADWLHRQIEAMKLAFADTHAHVADPAWMRTSVTELLDPGRLRALAGRIDPARAADPGHGRPAPGGTVYLATGDKDGMMVSLIQSNYYGFGSGVVVPRTGIALQNRGAGFVTDPGHPNAVAPAKRPFHTIIPGFVTRSGLPVAAFGVMGGPMQPQGHVQVLQRMLAGGENPQAAVDAPRWRVEAGLEVAVEPGYPPAVLDDLARRGHRLVADQGMGGFGGAQVVQRLGDGHLAASDPRKDGQAVGR